MSKYEPNGIILFGIAILIFIVFIIAMDNKAEYGCYFPEFYSNMTNPSYMRPLDWGATCR